MSKARKIILLIVAVILVSTLTYTGYVGANIYQTMHQIQDENFKEQENEDMNEDSESEVDQPYNQVEDDRFDRKGRTLSLLIAGVDSEEGQFAGRSDVLMLAAIDFDKGESTLVSIPRDSYVEIAGGDKKDKINHAFAKNAKTSMETVSNFLEVPVDHYVAVNFTGFEQFIDFLGGIELDVERTIYHNYHKDRIYLYPGLQMVDGHDALQYVRFRNDAEGDFGRNRRQQQVVKEVLNQTVSLRTMTGVHEVLNIVGDNIRTSMNMQAMFSLATNLSSLSGDNVETLRLSGDDLYINNIYYFDVDEESRLEVSQALKNRLQLKEDSLVDKVNSLDSTESIDDREMVESE